MLLASLGLGVLGVAALAADRTDRSFGQEGVVQVPLPPEAKGIPAGIQDLARAPGGEMVAAIGETSGYAYFQAARLNADGSLDRAFASKGFTKGMEEVPTPGPEISEVETQAEAIAVQPDGKVVLAGFQKAGSGRFQRRAPLLARYRPDGSLDSSFGNRGFVAPRPPFEPDPRTEEGGFVLHDIAIQSRGRIVAVGARNETHGGRPAGLVIAYRPDGRIDRGFGDGGRVFFPSPRDFRSTLLGAVNVLPGGKVLVAGYLHARLFLARLTPDGRLDRVFGGGDGKASVKVNTGPGVVCCQSTASLAVDRRGRILVQGEAVRRRSEGIALARFNSDGTLDRGFGRNGLLAAGTAGRLSRPNDIAVQGNGRIVVVGQGPKTSRGFTLDLAALRLLPSGRPDPSFGQAGLQRLVVGDRSTAFAALTQPNGRVVAGGVLAREVGEERFETELLLTRFLPD